MATPATSETRYEPVVGWPATPHGMWFREASAVGVGPDNRVYVFNRGRWSMMIFDTAGNFLDTWGAGEFVRPHGISFDPEGNLYLTDDGAHFVQKRTPDGKLLMQIGTKLQPSTPFSGKPFNRPTQTIVHPRTGDLYVTDGYGNHCIHRYSPEGKLLETWGDSGVGPDQFSLPHSICFLGDDHLLVADRENFRLKVLTLKGEFVTEKHFHRPQALFAGQGDDTNIYMAECRPTGLMEGALGLGKKVFVLDRDLNEITHIGNRASGEAPDQFISPHSVSVDSEGSIYVAEVAYTALGSRLDDPQEVTSLRKWRRVDGGSKEGAIPDSALPGYIAGLRYDGPGSAMPIDSPFAR